MFYFVHVRLQITLTSHTSPAPAGAIDRSVKWKALEEVMIGIGYIMLSFDQKKEALVTLSRVAFHVTQSNRSDVFICRLPEATSRVLDNQPSKRITAFRGPYPVGIISRKTLL